MIRIDPVRSLYPALLLHTLLYADLACSEPVPAIQVNGVPGVVDLTTDSGFSLTISMSADDWSGARAEWWLVALMPSGRWAYYLYPSGWRDAGGLEAVAPAFQGPVFDLQSFHILDGAGLLPGVYRIYFGVESIENGRLDLPAHYDFVTVNVSQGATSTSDVSGKWRGAWGAQARSGGFAVDVVQWGGLLNGTISVPEIGLSESPLIGSAAGNGLVFGDIGQQITFSGSLEDSWMASGGYSYPPAGSSGSWQGMRDYGRGDCFDADGAWVVSEHLTYNDCGDVEATLYHRFSLAQSNCVILGADDAGGTFRGGVDWSSVSLTGTRNADYGVMRITSASMTPSATGGSMSGSASWVWTDGVFTCNGLTALSASRN